MSAVPKNLKVKFQTFCEGCMVFDPEITDYTYEFTEGDKVFDSSHDWVLSCSRMPGCERIFKMGGGPVI